MESKSSFQRLCKIAGVCYRKCLRTAGVIQNSRFSSQEKSGLKYSHKIYTDISDYYMRKPAASIFRALENDYGTEEISKIQNLINALSLKSGAKNGIKENNIFDNMQNYIAKTKYTPR